MGQFNLPTELDKKNYAFDSGEGYYLESPDVDELIKKARKELVKRLCINSACGLRVRTEVNGEKKTVVCKNCKIINEVLK